METEDNIKILMQDNVVPKTLIWNERPLTGFVAPGIAPYLPEEHKKDFKCHYSEVSINLNERQLFSWLKMWGHPHHSIRVFRFSISPRYNVKEEYWNLDFPFMSVHTVFGTDNNHFYLKTVEEGKLYAQQLYDELFKVLVRK